MTLVNGSSLIVTVVSNSKAATELQQHSSSARATQYVEKISYVMNKRQEEVRKDKENITNNLGHTKTT
jgi:hypothetical protein